MRGENSEGAIRERVLIVDDEESITEMLKLILESRYRVTTVNDSLSALELILTMDYDLIISDIMMPRMNGIELYHEVKRKRPGMEKRILFISGALDGRFRGVVEEMGNVFLPKPFSLAGFLEAVNRFFTTYQLNGYSPKHDKEPAHSNFPGLSPGISG